ncbi:MAG: TrkA C-terminal domain-containing protein, partial [Frankia sp.]
AGVHRFTVASGSAADGHTIDQLDRLPEHAWISLVVRAGRLVPVSGSTRLHVADEILVLAEDDLAATLEGIFSRSR